MKLARDLLTDFLHDGLDRYELEKKPSREHSPEEDVLEEDEQKDDGQEEEEKPIGPTLFDGKRILGDVFEKLESAFTEAEGAALNVFDKLFIPQFHEEQGRRNNMEDKTCVIPDLNSIMGLSNYPPQSFYAVYDGHGGTEAAEYAKVHLYVNICKSEFFRDDPERAIKEGFKETDRKFVELCEREGHCSGATVIAMLVRGDKAYVAWLGDSQAMVIKNSNCEPLSEPHKPNREDEKKRIEESGGIVVWYGAWRVNGVLAVARAIGDKNLKQFVIGEPDVNVYDIDGSELGFVLACDGLWDVVDENALFEFVLAYKDMNACLAGVCEAIVKEALALGSADNISAIFLETSKLE